MKKLFLLLFLSAVASFVYSQQNTLSSGGNGSNASGSISISVGQVDYLNVSNANGNMHQGVQQPVSTCNVSIMSAGIANPTCGNDNGSITVSVSGATAPYSIQWSNGDFTNTADSLAPGQYVVQVSDAAGCYQSAVFNLNASNGPTISLVSQINVLCNGGATGYLDASASGGTAPLNFLWSTGSTNNAIQNLDAGVYDLTVTDANGCIANAAFTVTQPAALNITYNITSSTCGNNDGAVTANASGGASPYSFQWSANAGGQSGPSATNLGSGFYSCTITDNAGCSFTGSTAVVTTSAGPTLSFSTTPANGCNANVGGSIDLTPGGSTAYSFSWSNGASTEDISSLVPGNYTVVVTGSNGCASTGVASVQNGVANANSEICIVTVDTFTNTNKLVWEKPGSANGIQEYKIYREGSALNVFNHIKTLPYDSLSEYTDPVANPAVRAWRYKISHVDSCGNETPMSVHHKTIHLAVNNGLGGVKNLAWDAYDGFAYQTFNIWRFHQSTGWVKIDSLPSNLYSYTDISPPGNGTLKYAIEVEKPTSCGSTRGIINTTRSNIKNVAAPLSTGLDDEYAHGLTVFPNPTKNNFTIDLSVRENTKMLVRIYDARGREVIHTQRVLSVGRNLETLSIAELSSGIYFIQLQLGEKILRAKLVKED